MESASTSDAPASTPEVQRVPQLIPCPYDKEHKVEIEEFNVHVWKCRSERMKFHPHTLKLKRCAYNIRHFLPEEELKFHELFCKPQTAELRNQLTIEPIELNVADYLAAQKLRAELEDDEADSFTSDDSDNSREKKNPLVTSDIDDSDAEEDEDTRVTMKRLEYLEVKEEIEKELAEQK